MCHKGVTITKKGQRRSHRDFDGSLCPGSGIQVEEYAAEFNIDAVLAAVEAMGPPVVKLDAGKRSGTCPECGQSPRLNNDGTLRAHRLEPDTFIGPYCSGGGGRPRYNP